MPITVNATPGQTQRPHRGMHNVEVTPLYTVQTVGALFYAGVTRPSFTPATHFLSCCLQLLTALPAALAGASDRDVLNVAAAALASIYPGLGYVR
jgi:hypothetical protein